MGELTPDQKRLIFRVISERIWTATQDMVNHVQPKTGVKTSASMIAELNEIIEIIGPNGEDMVPTVDPKIRRFSSQAMLEGKCQP